MPSDIIGGSTSSTDIIGGATQNSDIIGGGSPTSDVIGGSSGVGGTVAYTPPGTPAPSTGGGGGGIFGFLGNAVHTVGNVTNAIGSVAGELGKELVALPVQATEAVSNRTLGTDLGPQWLKQATGAPTQESPSDVITGDNTNPNFQKTGGFQQNLTDVLNQYPILGGILRGPQKTGEEIAHPSRLVHNYSNDPVGSALNDIGTITMVLPAVGSAIHSAAIGGAETGDVITAARAGEASMAAARAAQVGDIIKQIGETPTISKLLSGGRAGLSALADKLATDPELLRLVDDAAQTGEAASNAPGLGAAAQAIDQTPGALQQTQARLAAQAGQRAQQGTLRSALGRFGASLQDNTKMAQNTVMDMMNRLKGVEESVASMAKTGVDTVQIPLRQGDAITLDNLSPNLEKDIGIAKQTIVSRAMGDLINNPAVSRLNEEDLADLKAAAENQGKSLPDYIKSLGFTSIQDATNGRINGALAQQSFVSDQVANSISKLTQEARTPGVVQSILGSANRLTNTARLALSPVTGLNRIGHGMLAVADNPNISDTFKVLGRSLTSNLTDEEKALLDQSTMWKHGAVWEASAKADATNAGRLARIGQALTNIPQTIMAKSPFLQFALKADDATRAAIILAAREAGASADEADLILGKTAGYFDRATNMERAAKSLVPFYNWHKQVMLIFEHMAESHPAAFAQFLEAANNMVKYNEANGITGSNTLLPGHGQTNLSFLSPFSSTAAALAPQELLSPTLKSLYPIITGTGVSGYPTSTPTGPLEGGGAQQLPAAEQELFKTVPQLGALVQGSQPRYGNGQINPGKTGGGWQSTASALLGGTFVPETTEQQNAAHQAKGAAAAAKIQASKEKSYEKKLAAWEATQ